MFTPRASITSAEPHLEVIPRLPCLATRTPAPAIVRAVAVEMLKVSLASPPVPQVSTSASRSVPLTSSAVPSALDKGCAAARMASAKADDLFDRFALHMQGHQQGGNLCVRGFPGQ